MSLRDARKAKNWTQGELADIMSVSRVTIANYETGARDINQAGIDFILHLMDVLDCKMSDLLTDPDLLRYTKKRNL